MRHRVKGKKLNRSTPHRKATLRALSSALIKEHRIETTIAKAKALRTFIEPLITTAKVDNTHNRRKVFSSLQDKYAVTELFETVGPAAADRPGGYTRVLKLGFRLGDSAEMAVIELVDFNDVQPEKRSTKKRRTRRAGRSNKPTSAAAEETEVQETVPESKVDVKEEPASPVEEKNDKADNDNTETVSSAEKEVAEDKSKKETAGSAEDQVEKSAEDKETSAETDSDDPKKKEG
ncbi:MAG: 50S ribosomal protein L17 [Balneolaceae bacterium]|nr:50S ribosomal protein L17 [Balneolaceae bacterium]